MSTITTSMNPSRTSSRKPSDQSITCSFSQPKRPSLPRMQGMDIADVKLHKLFPLISVRQMSSSPKSVSSCDSYSSVSSVCSDYIAIYPPEPTPDEDSYESLLFGTPEDMGRLGSIDQMLEWTRNVSNETERLAPDVDRSLPASGSKCPPLSRMPPQSMTLCSSSWSRVQQRMSLQLLCHGLENASHLGLYEVPAGQLGSSYVAAILLPERHINRSTMLEKKMTEIALQEWKDMPTIRVWWVDEVVGQPIAPPITCQTTMSWSPIQFHGTSSHSSSIDTVDYTNSRIEEVVEARLNRLADALRPSIQRRRSSWWRRGSDEVSPTSSRKSTLHADELESKLRDLVLSI